MSNFKGTWALLRLALRRDRVQLPVWLLVLTAVLASSVAGVADLYGTEQARITYAKSSAASVVSRAFNGPNGGSSLGSVVLTESFVTVAVLLILATIFAVVRHTRQNEETGRAELVGAGVVGRYALLTAAVLLALLTNLVFGVAAAAVLLAAGLPASGSMLTGAAFAVTGLAFAGVAAVTAQVAESARAANGLAAAVLGFSFVTRAAGDAFGGVSADGLVAISAWPSWLSPIGWAQQVRPFRDDAAWLLALPVVLCVALIVTAFALTRHRDAGTGMLPVRPGPATAPRGLLSPLGLAWRLQRAALLGWVIAVALLGLAFGAVTDEADDIVAGNPELTEILERMGGTGALVDIFLGAMLGIFGILSTAFTVQALLRMRAEEAGGPLESVLATAVSRPRWMLSHLACAVFGTALLLVVAGAATGLGYGLLAGDVWGQTVSVTGAALVRLPAALVLAGFVVAVFGVLPRLTATLSWAGVAVSMLLLQLGAVLDLPQYVMNVSPFTHVPSAPAADVTVTPLAALLAAALALAAAGFVSFQRRDLSR